MLWQVQDGYLPRTVLGMVTGGLLGYQITDTPTRGGGWDTSPLVFPEYRWKKPEVVEERLTLEVSFPNISMSAVVGRPSIAVTYLKTSTINNTKDGRLARSKSRMVRIKKGSQNGKIFHKDSW